jgi:hypothetical protein
LPAQQLTAHAAIATNIGLANLKLIIVVPLQTRLRT